MTSFGISAPAYPVFGGAGAVDFAISARAFNCSAAPPADLRGGFADVPHAHAPCCAVDQIAAQLLPRARARVWTAARGRCRRDSRGGARDRSRWACSAAAMRYRHAGGGDDPDEVRCRAADQDHTDRGGGIADVGRLGRASSVQLSLALSPPGPSLARASVGTRIKAWPALLLLGKELLAAFSLRSASSSPSAAKDWQEERTAKGVGFSRLIGSLRSEWIAPFSSPFAAVRQGPFVGNFRTARGTGEFPERDPSACSRVPLRLVGLPVDPDRRERRLPFVSGCLSPISGELRRAFAAVDEGSAARGVARPGAARECSRFHRARGTDLIASCCQDLPQAVDPRLTDHVVCDSCDSFGLRGHLLDRAP